MKTPKTAALFFDRVWSMPDIESRPPTEILAYGGTPLEIWAISLLNLAPDLPLQFVAHLAPGNPLTPQVLLPGVPDVATRAIALSLQETRGIAAVPVYDDVAVRAQEYKPGKQEVLVAALANLGIPHEASLTWEQISSSGVTICPVPHTGA